MLSACAPIGPDFEQPDLVANADWQTDDETFQRTPQNLAQWWDVLGDPVLDTLIQTALANNNNLETAGLRVLESRAQLAIAIGARYPQTQAAAGGVAAVKASEGGANTAFGDLEFQQYDIGATAAWELDFWGRFRRGVEAAEALYQGALAAHDDAVVLIIAAVADVYVAIRTVETQLQVARENVSLQQRSVEMTNVLFENGEQSELDVLQARTLLLSTQASIPELQTALTQARNAMSTLLGLPPGDLGNHVPTSQPIPRVPETIATGIPADVLRQRPDVRQAEQQARALNAQVGIAQANLRPSFSLTGSLGLAAAGGTDTTRTGDSGLDALFDIDSLTYGIGARFVWPFLNYGRLKSNVLVQDARLQQALVQYRETVLQAAREVEDSIASVSGKQSQYDILLEAVEVAQRGAELSLLRYREGFADYQRVLNAQQALFNQQLRLAASEGSVVGSVVDLYRALGGGWQVRLGQPLIDQATIDQMRVRADWDQTLETAPVR